MMPACENITRRQASAGNNSLWVHSGIIMPFVKEQLFVPGCQISASAEERRSVSGSNNRSSSLSKSSRNLAVSWLLSVAVTYPLANRRHTIAMISSGFFTSNLLAKPSHAWFTCRAASLRVASSLRLMASDRVTLPRRS